MLHRYPVTFIARKANDAAKAPLALLCATNTWHAYNATLFAVNVPKGTRHWSVVGETNDPTAPPAFCMYCDHASQQPTYKAGLRIPWPVAGPDIHYSHFRFGYSHLMPVERFTHVWLEKQGCDFDVYSSFDLHRDPDLLHGYRTLIINGHDKYWSIPMYEGVERYLTTVGRRRSCRVTQCFGASVSMRSWA